MNYIILNQFRNKYEVVVKGAVVGILSFYAGVTLFTSFADNNQYIIQSANSLPYFVDLPENQTVLIWSNVN